MNIITKQHAIDSVFMEKPWKKLTYIEIQRLSGKKSRSYIYSALNRLINEKIINSGKVGKSILYGLNWDSLNTQRHMGFLEEYKAWSNKHIPIRIISKLSSLAFKITPFFILLITGSYAKQKQTTKSDLDMIIICDDNVNPKSIYAELSLESDLSIPKVHLHVFKKSEFIGMLLDEKENYGKEITRYHLVFTGGTQYYSILREVIKHGFNG